MTAKNWYLVTVPHGEYTAQDVLSRKVVALEATVQMLSLEQLGYVRNLGAVQEESSFRLAPMKKRRSARGKQAEAGPAEGQAVQPVPGDEVRGADSPAD